MVYYIASLRFEQTKSENIHTNDNFILILQREIP